LRVAATGAVDPEKKVKVIRFSVFDKSLFYVFILYFLYKYVTFWMYILETSRNVLMNFNVMKIS